MKNYTRIYRVAIVLLLFIGAAVAPVSADDQADHRTIAAVDAIAREALIRIPLAGLSIAVTKGSDIVHAQGYGYANLEHQVPATPETVYRIGSVTKQFTAAAVLKLVEDHQLGLDDDARKYLPELSTGTRVVSIRQFLNHTSGIKDFSGIREAMAPRCLDVTQEQIINWINSGPFDFEPGEKYRYNNSGIWLLGVIIERLTRQTYGEYLHRNVFTPLGLHDTYYDSYERIIRNRAQGYVFRDGEFVHGEPNSPTRPYSAGALLSTVLDLVTWQRGLFSHQILSEGSLKMMTSPGRLNSGQTFPYGFGIGVSEFRGHRKIAHGGGQVGFRAFLSQYPEDKVIIAILANTQGPRLQPTPFSELEEQIAALVL